MVVIWGGERKAYRPQLEIRRAESGGWIFGEQQQGLGRGRAPSKFLHTTYRNQGERRKLSQWGLGGAPRQFNFYALIGLDMVTDGDDNYQ